jgi:hypothetical protein
MDFEIACSCGKRLTVTDGMAGTNTLCGCGRTVAVPALSDLRRGALRGESISAPPSSPLPSRSERSIKLSAAADAIAPIEPGASTRQAGEAITAAPRQVGPRLPSGASTKETTSAPHPGAEPVVLMEELFVRGEGRGKRRVLAALTAEAIWLQDVWPLRAVALPGLVVECKPNAQELTLTIGEGADAERLVLQFLEPEVEARWFEEIQRRQKLGSEAPRAAGYQPQGVSLVRRTPKLPHVVLSALELTGADSWSADRELQLLAGMLGADAVTNVQRRRRPELGWGPRQVSGVAVRLENPEDGKRLQVKFCSEEVLSLVKRLLLLLVAQAASVLLVGMLHRGPEALQESVGADAWPNALSWAPWIFGSAALWPLVLLGALAVLRWPALLRATALAVLAVSAGRVLIVSLAKFDLGPGGGFLLRVLGGPTTVLVVVDLAFIIIGVLLFLKANRLARDAHYLLPREAQAVPAARTVLARGAFAATAVFALVFLGFVTLTGYHVTAVPLDTETADRVQKALAALQDGQHQLDRGALVTAEYSLGYSLRRWEELTATPRAPILYKAYLAETLSNLGRLCRLRNESADALRYYERVTLLAPVLEGDPDVMTPELRRLLADARQAVLDLRRRDVIDRP